MGNGGGAGNDGERRCLLTPVTVCAGSMVMVVVVIREDGHGNGGGSGDMAVTVMVLMVMDGSG